MANLKNPPLFLRPSVVRSLVSNLDAIAKGVIHVPIAPIKLVDMPRRSEDPRLAKANDDDSQLCGWVAPPVASEPEDWPDAPLPDHTDPDLDRPEPVEDIPAEQVCSRLPVKESGLERMAAREGASQNQLASLEPQYELHEKRSPTSDQPRAPKLRTKKTEIAATRPFNVDRAGDAAQAPEGTSGGVTGELISDPANACEQPTKSTKAVDFYGEAAIKRRLQNAGRARSLAENSEAKAQRIARRAERAAEADAAAAEFAAALDRVRARREAGVEIVVPKPAGPVNSGAKLAEAIRRRDAEKSRSVQIESKRPLERASSREECPRCGVPGWKGCDHFLPCESGPPPVPIETADLQRVAKFTGSRQGISVLRIK